MNFHLDRLNGVHDIVRDKFFPFHHACVVAGQPLLIVHGWRSVKAQLLLYQLGRTYDRESGVWTVAHPALVVTNSLPGRSAHNLIDHETGRAAALAVDIVPLDPSEKPKWDTTTDQEWHLIWEIAHQHGLDPLGDQVGDYLPWDKGHLQEPGYKYIMDTLGVMYPTSPTSKVI